MSKPAGGPSHAPAPENARARESADARLGGLAPVFRAVNTPRQRRGIRLESIYWDGLRLLADDRGRSIGEMVEETVDAAADNATNLASLLRVGVVRWLLERTRRLETLTHLDNTNAIIQASPSPAFVLTADKRILLYNRAFLNLIQSRFLNVRADIMQKGLRLSLDTQLDGVVDGLERGDAPMIATGFAIGLDDRRVRGTLNLVLAPVHRQSMVIAFIVNV